MSFILKASLISILQLKGWFKSKTSIQEYINKIKNSYQTCVWIMWYMFSVQCEELRINHLTSLLVVTMPYACWFLWHAYHIENFEWRLHFQFGVAFWRVVLREVYFEGPDCVWRPLKTSILTLPASLTRESSLHASPFWEQKAHQWNAIGLLLQSGEIFGHNRSRP